MFARQQIARSVKTGLRAASRVAGTRQFSVAVPKVGRSQNDSQQSQQQSQQSQKLAAFLGATVLAGGVATGALTNNAVSCEEVAQFTPGAVDWKAVRKDIQALLDDDAYDNEPLGPIFIRNCWHSCGTFCKSSKTGGSDGGTIRHKPECEWGANAGLHKPRAILEKVLKKHPKLTRADLYVFAGVVAIEEMSSRDCPIGFREGRIDKPVGASPKWETKEAPDGRLPAADKGDMAKNVAHLRLIFHRMGFNDQEIVALSGAHALGRCHTTSSGYWGPWTRAPTTFSNEYFRLLKDEKWTIKTRHQGKAWTGPQQYEDKTGDLMMLPSDIALLHDPAFEKWVDVYYKDEKKFFQDFAKAFKKLTELGVPFSERHGFNCLEKLYKSPPEVGGF